MKSAARLFALLATTLLTFAPSMWGQLTPAVTTLHSFTGGTTDGATPFAALVQGIDGNFYGTTQKGGSSGYGTIFSVTPSGVLTTLYSFTGTGSDGAFPEAAMVQGSDGNFYGTTSGGNGISNGTIFSIAPAGVLTTLHSFTNSGTEGASPVAGLVQGSDGNFYGTTSAGGSSGDGTVFLITPAGVLTTLHSFTNSGTEGASPVAGLVQGSDGNFYGTTSAGGSSSDAGTIFQVTPAGGFTTLHSFTGGDAFPQAGLIQASDGNFYGTTSGAGYIPGTVFSITPTGVLTTLYSFTSANDSASSTDGATPNASLVQSSDGNFYGTTSAGGSSGDGTIFSITPAGMLTTLYSFTNTGTDGADPDAGLVQGSDGNFYGTTHYGVPGSELGTVFRLSLMPPVTAPAAALVTPVAGRNLAAGSTVTLSFDATPSSTAGLAQVSLYADGALVAAFDGDGNPLTMGTGRPVHREDASGTNNFQAVYTLPGVDKLINIVVVALDKLGHSTTSNMATIHSTVTSALFPLVTLSGVADGTHVKAGTATTVSVTASDPNVSTEAVGGSTGHRVVRQDAASQLFLLEYFLNGVKLGRATQPPYNFTFTPPTAGKYVVNAVATDSAGLATVSTPITVVADAPTPTVNLAVGSNATVTEGGAAGIIVVSRAGDTSAPLTVSYKAKGAALAGVDYKKLSGTVTIPAGATKAKIKIKPLAGLTGAGTLKLKLALVTPTDGSYAVGTGTVRIKLIGNN